MELELELELGMGLEREGGQTRTVIPSLVAELQILAIHVMEPEVLATSPCCLQVALL